MSTFREILYMIQDECKFDTDDSYYTQEHILYLIKRYRSFLFKQTYGAVNTIKKTIPQSAKQEICIDLKQTTGNEITKCESGLYLVSTKPIPDIMPQTKPIIYNTDVFSIISQIDLVYYDRMRYVGENKYLKNIIYAAIAPNKYLYLKSQNPTFLNLEKIKMSAVFEDIDEAAKLSCDGNGCDILDAKFPLEDALIPVLIQTVVKELVTTMQVPEDKQNNADDDTSNITINGGGTE